MLHENFCQFAIGQLIHHRLFDYRGVIFDVDATFQGSEDWYQRVAKSRPPKNRPWYHVLVDGSQQVTYVAEKNLELDHLLTPIDHPLTAQLFTEFHNGSYLITMN